MDLIKFSNYITDNSYFKISTEEFKPFYYELFGLNEELIELEDLIRDRTNVEPNIIEEAGDVLYYSMRLCKSLGYEDVITFLNETKNNINHMVSTSDKPDVFFWRMHKHLGIINGQVKKTIRGKEKDFKDIDLIKSCLEAIIVNLFIFLNMKGYNINSILDKTIIKVDQKNEKYRKDTKPKKKIKEEEEKKEEL